MVANGIKLIPGDDTIIKDFENASIKASDKLIGKLYSSELLEVVKEKLEKCRKSNPF